MTWRRMPALVVRECDTTASTTKVASSSSSSSSSSLYWDRDLLQAWSALDDHSSSSCNDDETAATHWNDVTPGVLTICYAALLRLAASVTALLLHAILDHEAHQALKQQPQQQQEESQPQQEETVEQMEVVVVAVAIPEGPLLPLAILAVHALTLDAHACHKNKALHVVLLPMEPEEPKHRLRHMLADARPSLLLALPGPDTLRLQSILNDIQHDEDDHQGDDTHTQRITTKMLDFDKLTRMGLQQCQANHHPPPNYNYYNSNDMDSSAISSSSSFCDIPRLVREGARTILARTTQISLRQDGWTPDTCTYTATTKQSQSLLQMRKNKISHVVYTSGTTGIPKGCVSSVASLEAYLVAKTKSHSISSSSIVLLASAVSFDPCFSDILATWGVATATLALVPRAVLLAGTALLPALDTLRVTHILTTPTLWSLQEKDDNDGKQPWMMVPSLEVIALGGEPIPRHLVHRWARQRQRQHTPNHHDDDDNDDDDTTVENDTHDADRRVVGGKIKTRLLCTYGVTEACVYQTCGEVFYTTASSPDSAPNNDSSHPNESPLIIGGQDVGMPMEGMQVRICVESLSPTDDMVDSDKQHFSGISQNGNELVVGEVVLVGNQLDEFSSYLNRPEITRQAFISQNVQDSHQDGEYCRRYHYRTGDRGYIHPETGHLHILGRIGGDGMVKINGVRIELGEIESAIIDTPTTNNSTSTTKSNNQYTVVKDCLAVVTETVQGREALYPDLDRNNVRKHIIAYCVLENTCLLELGLTTALSSTLQRSNDSTTKGLICSTGPLLTLLRERCTTRVRKGCVPSTFVIIPKIPLSPTGKRNRKALPGLSQCKSISQNMDSTDSSDRSRNRVLWEYGGAGELLAKQLVSHLNLQPCQIKAGLTTSATFGTLGGDSLAATRVVRALYSIHHDLEDNRFLGGGTGVLEGPFAASHLLRARNMGDYVDWLDSFQVCQSTKKRPSTNDDDDNDDGIIDNQLKRNQPLSVREKITFSDQQEEYIMPSSSLSNLEEDARLHDAVLEAITFGQTDIALALLDMGASPNSLAANDKNNRLSKVRHRMDRREKFTSSPLHLACIGGNMRLVKGLLAAGAKFNTPDATGSFPIHIACSGLGQGLGAPETLQEEETLPTTSTNDNIQRSVAVRNRDNDIRRMECVRHLLDAGAPLAMKDGNKQTLFHCAARSGNCTLIRFLMQRLDPTTNNDVNRHGWLFEWHDRWFRTPVHWAILNGHVEALKVLLDSGCNPNPNMPKATKSNRHTSADIETPLELCLRLYGNEEGTMGSDIVNLLKQRP